MMTKKWFTRSIVGTVFLLWGSAVLAVGTPTSMVRQTADQVLHELQQQKATLKQNPSVVYNIIDRVLVPHVDVDLMTRSVVGRNAWMSATPAEREAFTQQFKTLVIRTYGAAMAAYTNQTLEILPARDPNTTVVRSIIKQPDGPQVPVTYRVVNVNGEWKVFDFSVEGVSLIESFREQFASELAEGGGLARLTEQLKKHNQQNADGN